MAYARHVLTTPIGRYIRYYHVAVCVDFDTNSRRMRFVEVRNLGEENGALRSRSQWREELNNGQTYVLYRRYHYCRDETVNNAVRAYHSQYNQIGLMISPERQ